MSEGSVPGEDAEEIDTKITIDKMPEYFTESFESKRYLNQQELESLANKVDEYLRQKGLTPWRKFVREANYHSGIASAILQIYGTDRSVHLQIRTTDEKFLDDIISSLPGFKSKENRKVIKPEQPVTS